MGALRNTSLYFEAPDRAFTSETPPVEVVAFMESGSSFFFSSLRTTVLKAVVHSKRGLSGTSKCRDTFGRGPEGSVLRPVPDRPLFEWTAARASARTLSASQPPGD